MIQDLLSKYYCRLMYKKLKIQATISGFKSPNLELLADVFSVMGSE
jgi:hypothetical protein